MPPAKLVALATRCTITAQANHGAPRTRPAIGNDRFDTPPNEEVRALAQAVLDSGDLDRPLTTSGFETTPELEAPLDRFVEERLGGLRPAE